tara:strand:+ start:447 stop:803 length:357 start_codon:yes stop_codon:yes gene_type:complete
MKDYNVNIPNVKKTQFILSDEIHAGDNASDCERIASRITESEQTGELDETPERNTEKIDNRAAIEGFSTEDCKDFAKAFAKWCSKETNIYGQPTNRKHLMGRVSPFYGRQGNEEKSEN